MPDTRHPVVDLAPYPQPPVDEYAVELSDGRHLGVAEFGDPAGVPVLWFHGSPGARRQIPFPARDYARAHGLRLLGIERPGIGYSTPHLYRNIAAWSDDMEELADILELERFGLVGLSGGGPYLLATAHHLGDRVIAGAVFGGVAPTHGHEAPEGGLTRKALQAERLLTRLNRPLGNALSRLILSLHPYADPIMDALVKYVPGHETEMLGRPDLRAMFVEDLLLGSSAGMHAIVHDIILFARPWGFNLGDIDAPIHFWQGSADPMVPLEHARTMAGHIPGAGVTVCHNEGHLTGLDYTSDALGFIRGHTGA